MLYEAYLVLLVQTCLTPLPVSPGCGSPSLSTLSAALCVPAGATLPAATAAEGSPFSQGREGLD